jgi:hypothetical protein
MTWHNKAQQIIAVMCKASYLEANTLPNGSMRKRHVAYSVPVEAKLLIECLNRDDEETAKSIMAHNYEIQKIRNEVRI